MLGYRSILRAQSVFDGIDLHSEALGQLRRWLRSRRRVIDLDAIRPGFTRIDEASSVALLRREGQDGSVTTRFRLAERGEGGLWTSELLVSTSTREPGWILLDIHDPHAPQSRGLDHRGRPVQQWTAVPGLAPLLLDVVDASDGEMQLRSSPVLLRNADEDLVYELICDPGRRGLAILAGTVSGADMSGWLNQISGLTSQVIGQAGVYVLDADLTIRVNESLGHHSVPPGGLRTYVPDSDPASVRSARVNWSVSAEALARRPVGSVIRRLGWMARDQLSGATLPRNVVRADRVMDEYERENFLSSLNANYQPLRSARAKEGSGSETLPAQKPSFPVEDATHVDRPAAEERVDAAPSDLTVPFPASQSSSGMSPGTLDDDRHEIVSVQSLRDAIDRVAGPDFSLNDGLAYLVLLSDDYESLQRQAQENMSVTQAFMEELFEELGAIKEQRDWLAAQLDETRREQSEIATLLNDAEDTVRYLRSALAAAGSYEVAYSAVPEEQTTKIPADFDELLDMLHALEGIKFVGDPSATVSLNELSGRDNAVRKAWLVCLVLADYVRARAMGQAPVGGVHAYLRTTPDGFRGWSTKQHAPKESEDVATNPRFRSQRTFVVPGFGDIYMESHFKITQEGLVSPRLHYWDNTSTDGCVYIGHLGPHLDTKSTN